MRALLLLGLAAIVAGCDAPELPEPAAKQPEKPAVRMTKDFAVPVLMYHRICDLTPSESKNPLIRDLSVSPADFEAQLKYLKENGFTFLHVSDVERALSEGDALPEKAVAITMDDGYQDNFTEALPLLKKYEAKATIFMVTNNFEKPARLNWDQAKQMIANDVSFESHTVSHPDLTTLQRDQLKFELTESKAILEKGLNRPVRSVAYPAGQYNDLVVFATEEAGYLAGWKKGGGPVLPSNYGDPYRLPRIRIHGQTDIQKFKQRVTSGVSIINESKPRRI